MPIPVSMIDKYMENGKISNGHGIYVTRVWLNLGNQQQNHVRKITWKWIFVGFIRGNDADSVNYYIAKMAYSNFLIFFFLLFCSKLKKRKRLELLIKKVFNDVHWPQCYYWVSVRRAGAQWHCAGHLPYAWYRYIFKSDCSHRRYNTEY